ncbi:MAG: ribonuclease E activity regulator RraA [Gammaproteobacteria bacterium]|nr:ribonuclease E activity regulator RraA [Gammaproteobacteria bacterium]
MSEFKTADLCDDYSAELSIVVPGFLSFGQCALFCGQISTVKCFEDNSLVREAVSSAGEGRVLIVDGEASMRCALMGDQLATLAIENNWHGIIINGCIRDSFDISLMQIGVKALATHPLKSQKRGAGERDVTLDFAGVTFRAGDYVYADEDGIVVAPRSLF